MTTEFFNILAEETNTKFKATTCALAKLKFQRLMKKNPGNNEYGEILIKSAQDIGNEVEYDKYLVWLSNPRGVSGIRNPHPSCTGEVLPTMSEQPEFLKSSGDTVIVRKEQIKHLPNAVFIHVKPAEQEEEKVFES